MDTADDETLTTPKEARPVAQADLPVVARLVVEIRSDGTRTIARGAMEDVEGGERVAIEASGDSPVQLAQALVKSLMRLPLGAQPVERLRRAVRGLLPGKR